MTMQLSMNGYPEWVSAEIEGKLFPMFNLDRVTDEELWSEARENEELPHVGNIYISMVFNRIKGAIDDRYALGEKIDFSVNDIASGLYVDTVYVTTASEFISELEELVLNEAYEENIE